MVLPELPWPTVTGGKRAHHANLEELLSICSGLTLNLANIDSSPDDISSFISNHAGLNISVSETRTPELTDSKIKKIVRMAEAFLSFFPSVYYYLLKSEGRTRTEVLLETGEYDAIWVDHLHAMALIPETVRTPVILSTQNVESTLLYDVYASTNTYGLRRLKRWVEWKKMQILEGKILKKASAVVCLSDHDAQTLKSTYGIEKTHVLYSLLFEPADNWKPLADTKNLLFVGQNSHTPNREAIDWLVDVLAPSVQDFDASIRIDIVGSYGKEFMASAVSSNLRFHGRVTKEDLQHLLESCTSMICPVVLGSGIKVKILEAATNGIPVITTPESLQGLSMLDGCIVINRSDTEAAVTEICGVLNDRQRLARAASRNLDVLSAEYADRGTRMLRIIDSVQLKQ